MKPHIYVISSEAKISSVSILFDNIKVKKCYNLSIAKHHSHMMYGFTLIELLVVIAIISLLVMILLPSLNQAKALAKTAICKSNLYACGIAMSLYQSENNGEVVQFHYGTVFSSIVPDTWCVEWSDIYVGYEYLESPSCICPDYAPNDYNAPRRDGQPRATFGTILWDYFDSALYSGGIKLWDRGDSQSTMLSNVSNPARYLMLADSSTGNDNTWGTMYWQTSRIRRSNISSWAQGNVHMRHVNKANILAADFHVEASDILSNFEVLVEMDENCDYVSW